MELKSTLIPEKSAFEIEYGLPLVFLGSCFSDELSLKFKNAGFETIVAPFGTLFHPSAIANILTEHVDFEKRVFQREDLWFSWDASSKIWDFSKKQLIEKLYQAKQQLEASLQKASVLFLTFGSTWGYYLNESELITANCHKIPASKFTKRLTETADLKAEWIQLISNLKIRFPELNVVFTVSPVRHLRDGMIDNNRSKARLIELCHGLIDDFQLTKIMENSQKNQQFNLSYFPSFEYIIDDLRDYRFFEKDFVHPNSLAIDYIWEKVKSTYFSEKTEKLSVKVEKIRLLENHIIQFPNSLIAKKYIQFRDIQINEIIANTLIHW